MAPDYPVHMKKSTRKGNYEKYYKCIFILSDLHETMNLLPGVEERETDIHRPLKVLNELMIFLCKCLLKSTCVYHSYSHSRHARKNLEVSLSPTSAHAQTFGQVFSSLCHKVHLYSHCSCPSSDPHHLLPSLPCNSQNLHL